MATTETPSEVTKESPTRATKEWEKQKLQQLRQELSKGTVSADSPKPSSSSSSDVPQNAQDDVKATVDENPQSKTQSQQNENTVKPVSAEEIGQGHAENTEASGASAAHRSADSKNPEAGLETPVSEKKSQQQVSTVKEIMKKPSSSNGVASGSGPLTDLEKKHRRAERFGVALQLSEEEKRKSRAARFGDAVPVIQRAGSSPELKAIEEAKRKARAERFGLAFHSAVDDEARKKARLARFGQDAKTESTEIEKRNARVARFNTVVDSSTSEAIADNSLEPGLSGTVAST